MKKIIYIALIVCICFNLISCSNNLNRAYNQTIYYDLDHEPKTLDPQIANDNPSNLIMKG